ncbi:MAG TPA: iron-sulfur cluster assembly protein, partial [Acidimicrobiales bacterium]|nr:iron-sulfur cluster assembly protein [Acidimicrobiales bacterium]
MSPFRALDAAQVTTADADLAAAVAAVDDPDLGRSLGELGMVRRVQDRRRKVEVELAVPVAGWPGAEELEGRVRRALAALGV